MRYTNPRTHSRTLSTVSTAAACFVTVVIITAWHRCHGRWWSVQVLPTMLSTPLARRFTVTWRRHRNLSSTCRTRARRICRRPTNANLMPSLPVSHASVCFAFGASTLFVGPQEGHPACKNWVVGCWRGCLSGARCRQLMPLPLTVSHFSKIQICFFLLVPAHPDSPGKVLLNVCVCCASVCWPRHTIDGV